MKQKINSRLLIIALIAIFSTTIGIIYVCYNSFETQIQKDLKIHGEIIQETGVLQSYYANGNVDEIPDLFKDLKNENVRVTWIDKDGTVLYDNDLDVNQLKNHLDRPEIQQALNEGVGQSTRQSDSLKMNTYYYAIRLEDGTVLRVSIMAKTIISVFISTIPYIVLSILLILMVCFVLSHYLTRQLLEPIDTMAENLEDSIGLDPGYKELIPFANKIRSQHEKIIMAAKSRQDFTANVSHELKLSLIHI